MLVGYVYLLVKHAAGAITAKLFDFPFATIQSNRTLQASCHFGLQQILSQQLCGNSPLIGLNLSVKHII